MELHIIYFTLLLRNFFAQIYVYFENTLRWYIWKFFTKKSISFARLRHHHDNTHTIWKYLLWWCFNWAIYIVFNFFEGEGRTVICVLIRGTYRWVSQNWNNKSTQYIYFGLLGHHQESHETVSCNSFNRNIVITCTVI